MALCVIRIYRCNKLLIHQNEETLIQKFTKEFKKGEIFIVKLVLSILYAH